MDRMKVGALPDGRSTAPPAGSTPELSPLKPPSTDQAPRAWISLQESEHAISAPKLRDGRQACRALTRGSASPCRKHPAACGPHKCVHLRALWAPSPSQRWAREPFAAPPGPSHTPSPQRLAVLEVGGCGRGAGTAVSKQSWGQLVTFSPLSQVPFPHPTLEGGAAV
jgi:hypothetical protein